MRFVHPELLWLLLTLPLLWAGGMWSRARARRALRRFAAGPRMLAAFQVQVSVHRRATKQILLLVALAGVCVAAARPQWGTRMEAVTRKGIDIAVLLDTSLSMAAEDVAPSRLALARSEIGALVDAIPGDRIALVTFAGESTLLLPLTLDHGAVRLFLDSVEVESVQVPGTALAEALKIGTSVFRKTGDPSSPRPRVIVLFSDGEDHEGGIDEVLPDLQRAGVTVYAVGTGTARGAPIPLRDASGYKKDREGKVVTTRLDENVLQRLAIETGGGYYRATAAELEIDEIAGALGGLDGGEFGSVLRARYEDRYQIPLALALLALVAETLLGDRRRATDEAALAAEAGR